MIFLESAQSGDLWQVSKDGVCVAEYFSQLQAENAVRKMAKAASEAGSSVRILFHRESAPHEEFVHPVH